MLTDEDQEEEEEDEDVCVVKKKKMNKSKNDSPVRAGVGGKRLCKGIATDVKKKPARVRKRVKQRPFLVSAQLLITQNVAEALKYYVM